MTETNQSTAEIELDTPGQLLQRARLATGMTEDEVARRLNLRIQMVKDLEADNYGKSMAPTYTKGYLKAYARLLQLSEPQIMDAYHRLGNSEPEAVKMQSFSQRTRKEAHHSRLMWLTYAIIMVIVVMFILWWLQADQASDTQGEPSVEQEIGVIEAPEQLTAGAPLVSEDLVPQEDIDPQSVAVEAQILPEPSAEVVATAAEAVVDPESAAVSDAQEAATAIESASASAPVTANGAEIVMTFSGDCWVKVTDADGEVLLTGVSKAGREARVTGKPPFKLVLGAPQVVQLEYQGESFNMSQFTPGKPARFELPARG